MKVWMTTGSARGRCCGQCRSAVCLPGFSLVEVLVAVTMLTLVFLAAMAALNQGFNMVENARFGTHASQILQSEMETLRMMDWAQIEALPSEEDFVIDMRFMQGRADRYQGIRRVEDVRPGMRRVVLELNFTSMDGRNLQRRYFTFFGQHGLNDYNYRAF